jgi:hypothetical protein
VGAFIALIVVAPSLTAQVAPAPSKAHFANDVAPVFNKYCIGCHAGAQPKGDILLRFNDEADARSRAVTSDDFWDKVATEIETGHMPPATVKNRPTDGEKQLLVNWIRNDVLMGGKPDPGPVVVRRMNSREYANTIRDLLYLPADYNAAAEFPADERGDGFDNNAGTLTLSPLLIEKYLAAAEKAVAVAMVPGVDKQIEGNANLLGPNKINDPGRSQPEDFANRQQTIRLNMEVFLPRAWRRPVTKAEVDDIMKFVALGFAHDGESRPKAQSLAIRAALMSPNFLFRVETDPKAEGPNAIFQLNEHQLASRLSYFLWSTMPDDALFAAANQNRLRANLDGELRRMLKDPKAASLITDFLGQWLEIRGLEHTPNVDKALLASMRTETEKFFEYIVSNDRPITDLLDADYSFVDERLARIYGIPGVTGPEFRKVQLNPLQRGGFLTQASFLTLTSKPLGEGLRTSPVVRGKFILENLFNQKIPPPPPNVPDLPLDTNKQLTGTVRQIFEQHRENAVCAGCHARMDPYGFALENYSGTGEWRDTDNGLKVDASGEINGRKFVTPADFRKVLQDRKADFRRAVVRKVFSYAMGRGIQGLDRPAIDQMVAQVEKDGDKFSSVIRAVVTSYPFQNARGGVSTAANEKPGLKPVSLNR